MTTWTTFGTYTLLFTDIEGSTRRWGDDPAAMSALLRRHDAIMREAIARHDGQVFKTIGDAFCALFASAQKALCAAMDAQSMLNNCLTPDGTPLRVRMALHTGDVEQRDNDYFGPPVNRVARLLGVAHGGQTLLTQATFSLVREHAPDTVSFYDLGEHQLRDITGVEHIYQANPPGLSGFFPPLRISAAPPGNLPTPPTTFIGRDRERRDLSALLAHTKLLTLTGIGGTGKTRLAIQVADENAGTFPDGAWFVDLAPVTECALVAQAIALTLGISLEGHREAVPELLAFLRSHRLLLILDNCEHLVETCAQLVSILLQASAELTILATSREPLHLPGESVYRVLPLSCPASEEEKVTPDDLLRYEAVRLFLERATAVTPDFQITPANAAAVQQLCARLDGLPMAIELATARLRAMTVEQILDRLRDRFRLLTSGSRVALPRQQTLRALIDWSYDLLTASEQALLRRLAVFAGGCTLEAAEAVCADDVLFDWDVMDALTELVEKSLILADATEGADMRYRMLEVVREYSEEKLRDAGEEQAFRQRHAAYFLEQVAREKREIAGAASAEVWQKWARFNVTEADNFRAALRHTDVGLDGFPLALTFFRRFPSECHSWLDVLLARNPDEQSVERAEALLWAAHVCRTHIEAYPYVEESLYLYRHLNLPEGICECLRTLSRHAVARGNLAEAEALREECQQVADASGNKNAVVHAAITSAVVALARGDAAAARPPLEQALRIRRAMQLPQEVAFILFHAGTAEYLDGQLDRARALADESHQLFQQTGNPSYTPPLRLLGDIARAQERHADALAHYRQSILDQWRQVDAHTTILLLERFGYAESGLGNAARAVSWMAVADALRGRDAYPRTPAEAREWDRELARARAQLSEAAFQTAWEDGQRRETSDILGAVLAETAPE